MHILSQQLIEWYKTHARDLPWRHTYNPFYIWVSEIILQQTQVKQGYDYYLRFIEAFPTVEALYKASSDALMKQWQGLGYYSRARNMHKAAKQIMEEYKGHFPNTYSDLLKLSGVGPYTASAIASFAYGLPYPVLDGNVYRFLSRYFAIQMPINESASYAHYIKVAEQIMDKEQAALHNQAIMEFGALHCKVQSPDCANCVLNGSCSAYAKDMVTQLPIKIKKVKVKKRYLHFFYLHYNGSFVIEKRTAKGIWQDLYQLPMVETKYDNIATPPKEYIIKKNEPVQMVQECVHLLTHQRLVIRFYVAALAQSDKAFSARFCATNDWQNFAFPKPIFSFLHAYHGL